MNRRLLLGLTSVIILFTGINLMADNNFTVSGNGNNISDVNVGDRVETTINADIKVDNSKEEVTNVDKSKTTNTTNNTTENTVNCSVMDANDGENKNDGTINIGSIECTQNNTEK